MEQRVFGNRYQVTERIGMGGMAEVFKATDMTLGRTVAVKVMLPQYATDSTFAARFRQEAQAAANLQNPYIVNIYDWGQDAASGQYYIVMEYVRGTDLKSAIGQRGSIHPRKVAEIASQVCSALGTAHGYDIIHRDIKSANIMVQADGNTKVMDFGIASAGNGALTEGSCVLGTAHYVSPEQAQGRPLGAASDLYSLGVVMYEACTGRVPFDGPDAVSVALKQVNEQPVPPRAYNAAIDAALEQIILRAMAKDPYQRFSTANEMKAALDAYLKTGAAPGAAGAAVAPIPTMAAGATTVMSPVEAAAEARRYSSASQIEAADEEDDGKKKLAIIIAALALVLAIVIAAIAFTSCSAADEEEAEEAEELVVEDADEEVATVSVPNLLGLSAEEAEETLADLGLTGKATSGYSEKYDEGTVCDQSPAARTSVEEGTVVSYVVSQGEETKLVTVVSVIGYSQSEAVAVLEQLGLTVKTKSGYSDSVSEGQVAEQSISAGTQVTADSTITLTVSAGASTVTVPDVVGQGKATAKAALKNAGFSVSIEYTEGDNGKVVSQSPSASSNVSRGSTVTIYVGTGNNASTATDYEE